MRAKLATSWGFGRWWKNLGPMAVLAFGVPVILPLLQPGYLGGTPGGTDAFAHLFRVYELDQALRQGILFPRWLPSLVYGYGYPLFNFYPPLTYYLAELFHLVLPLDFPASVKAVFGTGIILSGIGMYLLAKEHFGSKGGTLAAVAYLYFPYFLFDLYHRVALAEYFALSLIPFTLWSLHRLVHSPTKAKYLLFSALSLASIVLSHHLTTLSFMPVAILYTLWQARRVSETRERPSDSPSLPGRSWSGVTRAMAAFALALALSAFYWVPMVWELQYVFMGKKPQVDDNFLRQLLPLAHQVQTSLNFNYQGFGFTKIGLATALFSGLAFLLRGIRPHPWRSSVLFFAGLLTLVALFTSPWSAWLWERLPFATVMQFPSRLLIHTGLVSSALIGSLATVGRTRVQGGVLALVALIVVLTSLWQLRPDPLTSFSDAMVNRHFYLRHEASGATLGTTIPAQFLPRWVGGEPQELSRSSLPSSSALESAVPQTTLLGLSPTALQLQTRSDGETRLTFHQFYFLGWEARLDGVATPLEPLPPWGLVSLRLPPGQHTLELSFGDTPVRQLANGVSLVSALVLVIVAGRILWSSRPLTFSLIALAGLILGVAWWQVRPANTGNLTPTNLVFGDQLQLLGWRVEETELPRLGTLRVTLVWQVLRPPKADLLDVLVLIDRQGKTVAAKEKRPLYGASPTNRWHQGEVIIDQQDLYLTPGTPRGSYTLDLGLKDQSRVWVKVNSAKGVTLGQVKLHNSAPMEGRWALNQAPIANFDDQIVLLDYTVSPAARPLRAGETLSIALTWQVRRDLATDYSVFVHLVDAHDQTLAQDDSYPVEDLRYTSAWEKGRLVLDRYKLIVPPSTPTGRYRLVARLYDRETMGRLPVLDAAGEEASDRVELAQVLVKNPSKPPEPQYRLEVKLNNQIRLVGYSLSAEGTTDPLTLKPGQDLVVSLHWRATAPIERSYTVFVHLKDATGKVRAQRDGLPREGNYPTDAWMPGEALVDVYRIALPPDLAPGDYQLTAGMYYFPTMERAQVVGQARDEIPLTTPQVR